MGLVLEDMALDSTLSLSKKERVRYHDQAHRNYNEALEIERRVGDVYGQAHTLGGLAGILLNLKRYDDAEAYIKEALRLAVEVQSPDLQSAHHLTYCLILQARKDYKGALDHYYQHKILQDSLYNTEKRKALAEKELAYEFEKKEAHIQLVADKEKEKIHAVAAEEKKQQQLIIMSVGICLLLTVIFAGFIFNRFRLTRKQNAIIELQKQQVESKNQEIGESIEYARHLQSAILPPDHFMKKYLPASFVIYKPKDVVAGDFYWMEVIHDQHTQEVEHVFVAAADSTGHGVPGAMVSVICGNALNRAVLEYALREPGQILDKTRDIVIETFRKSEQRIMDGMDISLLAINKKTNSVTWAGANNNLWYVDSATGHLNEIAADKQPVGWSDVKKPFTTHHVLCGPETTCYLFTDGYADQFGGPRGKKFMYRRLKDSVLLFAGLPMDEQRSQLEQKFSDWKKDLEQVDDVCIVGINPVPGRE
jgi:serine phosphatase RsbU (regulator of sigma subunit)